MRRALAALILALCVALPAAALAEPEETDVAGILEDQLNAYDFSDWQRFLDDMPEETRQIWDGGQVAELIEDFALGSAGARAPMGLKGVLAALTASLRTHIGRLAAVIGVAVITGVVNIMLGDDGDSGVKQIASLVCYGMGAMIVAYTFAALMDTASSAVEGVAELTELITPVLVTLLGAVGSTVAGGMIQPLMAFLCSAVISAFKSVILPLIMAGGVIGMVGNLTGKVQLSKLFALSKSASKWTIGIVFTVFLGTVSIQGLSVSGIDTVSLRALKYTIDKSVPIVGGALAGTFDTVRGCTVLIKNAAGAAAVLLTAAYVFAPLVEIAAAAFAMKLSASITEPVADERMPRMLGAMAEVCDYLFASVAAVALMLIIVIALVIAAGGVGV